MKIENTEVLGLKSALRVMRHPFKSGDKKVKSDEQLSTILSSCKSGSGHDSFLKGIVVKSDWTADHSFWLQESRYHFIDIASSESKMHAIQKGNIGDYCHRFVGRDSIILVAELIHHYNNKELKFPVEYRGVKNDIFGYREVIYLTDYKELFEAIIMNTPIGYELKAGIVTNYLQLKTMYAQRKNHKISSWNTDFRAWVEELPESHLIIGEGK